MSVDTLALRAHLNYLRLGGETYVRGVTICELEELLDELDKTHNEEN